MTTEVSYSAPKQPPRILLLQARRQDDPALPEERVSFAARAGLPLDAFVPHDLLSGPPALEEARMASALMVGGSGEYFVSKGDLPRFEETLAFFRAVVAESLPLFASCFGFHLLTAALGGEVIYDPEGIQIGTHELTLTREGADDELLGILPREFAAQLGRKDRASRLPPGAVHLASSREAPYQAFRLRGKPIWATQFHPELTRSENLMRFKRYAEIYTQTMTPAERQAAFDGFHESPHTAALIPKFLELLDSID
ncbi:MAG TPA: type 1 glutamine amidotransferase [Anaerolineales bacterium]|nr:type 1 glutamine amidotransferase [Anaerolineales bacterium]